MIKSIVEIFNDAMVILISCYMYIFYWVYAFKYVSCNTCNIKRPFSHVAMETMAVVVLKCRYVMRG